MRALVYCGVTESFDALYGGFSLSLLNSDESVSDQLQVGVFLM